MKLAQYRGRSWVSRAIKWHTSSIYSHTAILLPDGEQVIEAWHRGGVFYGPLWKNHTPGTVVDIFEIEESFSHEDAQGFALEQVGKKYDFRMVSKFVSRRQSKESRKNSGKWFCSELGHASVAYGGLRLLHTDHWKVTPELLSITPLVRYAYSIVTLRNGFEPAP